MKREKKQVEVEDEGGGAPEWMVTYSDCMTLLLTFFVLLLTFSSFDDKVYRQFEDTLFEDLPKIYLQVRRSKASFLNPEEPLILAELEDAARSRPWKANRK